MRFLDLRMSATISSAMVWHRGVAESPTVPIDWDQHGWGCGIDRGDVVSLLACRSMGRVAPDGVRWPPSGRVRNDVLQREAFDAPQLDGAFLARVCDSALDPRATTTDGLLRHLRECSAAPLHDLAVKRSSSRTQVLRRCLPRHGTLACVRRPVNRCWGRDLYWPLGGSALSCWSMPNWSISPQRSTTCPFSKRIVSIP